MMFKAARLTFQAALVQLKPMLMRRAQFWLLLVILTGGTVGGQSSPTGPIAPIASDWRQDIDEIVRDIRAYHPNPFSKTGELAFVRESERLKDAVPLLTEEQRVVGAMRLVALIGDGHTRLEPANPRFALWYPVRLYEFTDGYFVTSAHPSVRELVGAQILEIAGRPTVEVADAVRLLIGSDNAFHRKEKLYALHNGGLMKGLGYAASNGELKIKAKLRDGKIVERILTPHLADDPAFKGNESTFKWQVRGEMFGMPFGIGDEWTSAYKDLPAGAFRTIDNARPPHLTYRGAFVARALPQQSGYYIQANQVDDMGFVPSFQRALHEVDQLKPRHLIVDLRYNFGGDGSQVAAMVHEFVRRAPDTPWKSLYILTGGKTFSAAVMVLAAFVDHTQFTIVGEPAGAPLNSYGDATSRNYPRTGLHLYVSTLWHQLGASDDIREFIPVDVPAPFSFADYSAGRDPAVDAILRGDEMRSLSVIARSDGGAAARKVWLDRKQRFGEILWWLPPREIDFRNVCRDLAEEKRTNDALETCKLSTEIHPFNWHSWFNMGLLLRRFGRTREGLAYYRCTVGVDPSNHNADAIRELLQKSGAETVPLPPGCPLEK